jgi:hypothetical protein
VIPIAEKFLTTTPFFNLNLIAIIILGYTIFMGIHDLVIFLLSFIGRVRVMPKDIGPTDIISRMNPQVEEFIQNMQERMGHQYKTSTKV